MNFALILAGGTGQRMGNVQVPKQFLLLNNKAILLHTLEKFYLLKEEFEKIIIAAHPSWFAYTRDLIEKNFAPDAEVFEVITGGGTRHDTVKRGLSFLQNNFELTSNDIILTHDAVRPFISYKIIKENIEKTLQFSAVDTVISSIDTIVYSEDGEQISEIPERSKYYHGQTPQSFKIQELIDIYNNVSEKNLDNTTDVAKLYRLLNKTVYLVKGEQLNFKITTPFDLTIARALLERDGKGD
ncbi:2-C-methyl-D-erythritol 4-phosphate cytidylyltransferase [Psychrobacillus sp. NPDC096623]|uniref:IspD/TarI family cytidylyltransferase n=1 Tax=Psychrobacillus sp. NPDC096623 TaxID=3364492 RepID=UPI00382AEC28